jgi:hypothetical protein
MMISKKSVLGICLILVIGSFGLVFAQSEEASCQKDIPRCPDGSAGIYDYTDSCNVLCWNSGEHDVWHDAEDIKVASGGKFYSLQDWVDDIIEREWVASDHDSSHDSRDIRVDILTKFGGTGSTFTDENGETVTIAPSGKISLENYILENYVVDWASTGNWHDAEDIKIISEGSVMDLQTWIDVFVDEPGVVEELFFDEGDVITLMEQENEEFLNVDSPSGLFKLDDGIYANVDGVSEDSQRFTIYENSEDGDKQIQSNEKVDLVSVETGNGLKYIVGGDERVHAKAFSEAGFFQDYNEFSPKIVNNSGDGRIKCGDVVYFKDGDDYLDVDFGNVDNFAHLGSKKKFIIYDESGDCSSGDGTDDEESAEMIIDAGLYDYKDNWDKVCEGRDKYVELEGSVGSDIIENILYDVSCEYGDKTNNRFDTIRFMSDEWTILEVVREPHMITDWPNQCFIYSDETDGEDTIIFEAQYNSGGLDVRVKMEDSSGDNICPVYKVTRKNGFCAGGVPLLGTEYAPWDELRCEIL